MSWWRRGRRPTGPTPAEDARGVAELLHARLHPAGRLPTCAACRALAAEVVDVLGPAAAVPHRWGDDEPDGWAASRRCAALLAFAEGALIDLEEGHRPSTATLLARRARLARLQAAQDAALRIPLPR